MTIATKTYIFAAMNEETVTISKKEYESLKEDALWLRYLKRAGVDNWQGIDYAYEIKRRERRRR